MGVVEIVIVLVSVLVGMAGALFVVRKKTKEVFEKTNKEVTQLKERAQQDAEKILSEAKTKCKDLHVQKKVAFDKETSSKRNELQKYEKKLLQKEDNIDKKADLLNNKEIEVLQKQRELMKKEGELEKQIKEANEMLDNSCKKLERVAGLTQEEAKEELKNSMLDEARIESVELIKKIERESKQTAENRAKEIVCLAIQRVSAEFISDVSVSVVSLPSEDMKGRIIGREGRNIRAIEACTGVDVIIDDTPEAVVLSSFDPIRRGKAKLLLEKLLADGRIHPARIEELSKKIGQDFEEKIKEIGEQAAFDLGVNGIHPELLKLLGRLKYYTMGQQSILQHCIEVAVIAGIISAEIGYNVKLAKRAALLHSVGKAVGQEIEGAYNQIGAEIAKKYGEPEEIVTAIKNHLDTTSNDSYISVLIAIAKKLSAQRPGARKEILETYIKRLDTIEETLKTINRVDQIFVIQAGKEIRVLVESEGVSDDDALLVMRDIENSIKNEVVYPGQIQISLLKETRATSFAS